MSIVLAGTLPPLPAQARPDPAIPVILSTDCGTEIDDQWAVVYLTISPQFDVRGFIGNHAPNDLTSEKAKTTIRDILENRLGMPAHPPILAGADGPLKKPHLPIRTEGVDFLLLESRGFSPTNRLTVFVIGSHTDVASAILLDPSIVERIRVAMMGFDDWPGGGDAWNVKNDLAAARIVLESGVPLVAGSGAVAKRHLSLTDQEADALVGRIGNAGPWLVELFAGWPHRMDLGEQKVWPIWDFIVIADALGYTRSQVYHRPRIRDDLSFDHDQPHGQVSWIEWVDRQRVWDDFVAKLRAWESHRP